MFEDLKALCSLDGVSGHEDRVRDYIIERITGKAEYTVDPIGNIHAFKKGRKTPKHKIMLDAHMDEVGFIITSIQPDGTLTFSAVGGVDTSVIMGRQVKVGDKGIYGVVGAKAVHNLSEEERENVPDIDSLFIDIGATDMSDAEMYVSPGDVACFDTEYTELGDGSIMAKAIDDRFGCALLLSLIDSQLPCDLHFSFSVQEEIGLRGAKVSAYNIGPDIALVIEATTAADIDNVPEEKQVCALGSGAVVSFMDGSAVYDRELYKLAFQTAEEKGIPCQTKTRIAGGNNSGAIHTSKGGVRTLAISAPCRYLHSPSCVVNREDLKACRDLVAALLEKAE